jgi:CRP-like cAMP-binding protein
MTSTVKEKQSLLDHYIQGNEIAKAINLLAQLAVSSAKARDFTNAEVFRDRLYQMDGSALSAILKVNEIIDREKNRAITPIQKNLWPRFFEGLSAQEAGDFFLALRQVEIAGEQVVLEQGRPNDCLYLIYQGRVKLVYQNVQKQILIKNLISGDFFGEDTFFSVNVCTVSAVAFSDVTLGMLDTAALEQLKRRHSLIEENLREVCLSGRSTFDCLRQKGMDRRSEPRIRLRAKVIARVLKAHSDKQPLYTVKGELCDISRQGLSFCFYSKNTDAVRLLIGMALWVRIYLNVNGAIKELDLTGIVRGVQNHPIDELSVHMQLNRPFSPKAMKIIQKIASGKSRRLH